MRQDPFLRCADLSVVRSRRCQAERVVGATTHIVGIVVILSIVLPEADGTDVVTTSLVQRDAPAAGTRVRTVAAWTNDIEEHHASIVHLVGAPNCRSGPSRKYVNRAERALKITTDGRVCNPPDRRLSGSGGAVCEE